MSTRISKKNINQIVESRKKLWPSYVTRKPTYESSKVHKFKDKLENLK